MGEKRADIRLILTGIFVHLVILYSIFDIYFKSPLVHGMRPIDKLTKSQAPAKRLVLFVADGLRADYFFDAIDTNHDLFLSKKKTDKTAVFATSNTQMPTETRPGHVAMIAGFYEDLSAVAKGWKENLVEFDSVFNKSRYTWAWGSPDVLDMFKNGNAFMRTYDSNVEDFASQNASLLDTWVLHHVKKFFYHSQANRTATSMLNQDKIVLFLHLLGLDTNGHSNKPHSKEYKENIVIVDKIVEEVSQLIEETYGHDNKTAFVYTSDHGMTDWGSHGSGDDSETKMPFVAWGAGIQPSEYDREKMFQIQQIDITPLMSSLIGIPIPINSLGKVPLDLFSASLEDKVLMLKQNALQIIEQLKIKHEQSKNSALFFKEYSELGMNQAYELLSQIDNLIDEKRFEQARERLDVLINKSHLALDYYHKYNKFYLGSCIVFSCIGWIVFMLINNLKELDSDLWSSKGYQVKLYTKRINQFFFLVFVLTVLASLYQQFPLSYYFYNLLPIYLWWLNLLRYDFWLFVTNKILNENMLSNLIKLALLILGVECMVLTFFYRWIFSILLVAYSIYLAIDLKCDSNQSKIKAAIILSSLSVSVFPLLPVIQGYTHFYLVYLACLISIFVYYMVMKNIEVLSTNNKLSLLVMGLNIATLINILVVRKSIEYGHGLPRICQAFSYTVLLASIILPTMCEVALKKRLIIILFSLINFYMHLSISYEGLFVVFLCYQLICLLLVESFRFSNSFNIDLALAKTRASSMLREEYNEDDQHDLKNLSWSNLFRVYLLVFHLLLSFFGTGNMASLNSFDTASVYTFQTIFHPFLMAVLIILKIIVPFLIVISVFYCIYEMIELSIGKLYLLLMIISDLMALHFFFLIRTEGSWMDIGISISHYITVILMILAVSIFFSIIHYWYKFELLKLSLIGLLRRKLVFKSE